ncbi:MAG: DNA-binding NtrC family response regulator [Polyangiales bacterium]|jgi:DNA-binding NtrC family response regulator
MVYSLAVGLISTHPSEGHPGLPVRTLVAEVVEGPDKGLRAVASSDSLTIGTAEGNDLLLSDRTVSRYHLELGRGAGGIVLRDLDSTNGTLHAGARIRDGLVPLGSALQLGDTRIVVSDGERVTVELHDEEEYAGIVGRTPIMRRLMAQIRKAARADTPVLVIGESGTGKELVARALHDEGRRSGKPFVTVDCGALAPTLVASELFGHEKGAFTGADRQHQGAFERAHGGTLFLDELGELPSTLQPTLLGALERGTFRRVGGRSPVEVDVRVVCATHRDLRAEVNAGRFRLDLYYRVAVVVLNLPPLRERTEDVPILIERFLEEAGHAGELEEIIPPDTMTSLCAHRWPGNVRELRNVVEATLAMGEPPRLHPELGQDDEAWMELGYKQARQAVLGDFEGRYLRRLIERAEGNVSRAAREARMDRTYLIKLLQKHGLR